MRIFEREIEQVVLGSGAAGFQAALRLRQYGEKDVALVTEHVKAGTSRNTGSDKQTYYKLSLAGGDLDSVRTMAEDLFAGQCVDGDLALCEAALSARCFFALTELGVPFPYTEQGEFMGYKTDHDRGRRATSAGPYTSRLMTECLEREAKEKEILILDQLLAVKILKADGRVKGLLCLNKKAKDEAEYVLIWCKNLILAMGGPAGMYHDSVYPLSQTGSSGLAFEAGVKGKNLTEWQFGLASLNPRWNVSGTYMQVLPTFLSTDANGGDEREFLLEYFQDKAEMQSMIFLKGYQWPFDVNKIFGGSSIIDLLVYRETVLRGRRVYLDFTRNPGTEIFYEKLLPEAYSYLSQADACFGTPIERLKKMNEPAIHFYQEHKVDLWSQRLEVAVCAQHNNGGLATDECWETNIRGIFAVGEVCGSHGVTRPGGTALNAGQVGALRAAECIHIRNQQERKAQAEKLPEKQEKKERETLLKIAKDFIHQAEEARGEQSVGEMWAKASKRMSAFGGMIRNKENMQESLQDVQEELEHFYEWMACPSVAQLPAFYKLRDMLLSQKVYLTAMLDYCVQGGGSRGSALYTDEKGKLPVGELPELYRCCTDDGRHKDVIQELLLEEDGSLSVQWRAVRPIPEVDYFFEKQWEKYRKRFL